MEPDAVLQSVAELMEEEHIDLLNSSPSSIEEIDLGRPQVVPHPLPTVLSAKARKGNKANSATIPPPRVSRRKTASKGAEQTDGEPGESTK